jgi:fructokinase
VVLLSPTDPAVVVAGDALVDLTTTRSERGTPAYEPHPGGSCLNVAAGLGRLGVPTSFLARVSDDGFGRLLRRHLSASGVLPDHLLATSDLTTLAVADLEEGNAAYAFHSAGCADRGLLPEHLADLPDGGRLPTGAALHVGSIALVLEPQATTLEGLLRRESGHRLVSLDPNVRPGLIGDRDRYRVRLESWVGGSDLVKASDEDLAWLYPGEDPDAVAQRWLAAGAALVVITAGADGAFARTGSARVRAPAVAVTVADTVGAGDAVTAALLAQLHWAGRLTREGLAGLTADQLAALLTGAVWAGGFTCTRSGAEPPWLAELRASGTVALDGAAGPGVSR